MSQADDVSDQPVKRAPVVYGKRSSNLPQPSPVDPADGQELVHGCDARTVPSQRRGAPLTRAPDSERCCSPDTDDTFQFGFRHRLKELDEQFGNQDTHSSKLGLSPDNKAVHARLSQVKGFQNVSMGTTPISFEVPLSPRDLFRTSSPSPSTPGHPPESPPARGHTGRVTTPVLSPSDVEEPSRSSPVSPVRHVITTPHSRSSPTPPTSGEISMVGRKVKGKAPARDALPLLFDAQQPLAGEIPTKSKKGRRSEPSLRSKIRAPTKKERREAAFESSRIAAGRSVDVDRTQEQKHSLLSFFANLRRDNIVAPALGTELPSDPIERFSSPTDKSTLAQPLNNIFGTPTGFLGAFAHAGATNQPSPSGNTTVPPAAADSDDEMPSVVSIIRQAAGKQQRLRAIKQVALQYTDTSTTVDNSGEDDDLLVVKDDMHSIAHEEAVHRKLDKVLGSPAKVRTLSGRSNHPSVRPPAICPRKLSKQELQELAKPSFARTGNGTKDHLSKKELDQLMIMQHAEVQSESIKRQEEEWVRRGGRLLRDSGASSTPISLPQRLEAYAERGLKAAETCDAARDEARIDESNEDDLPGLQAFSGTESLEERDMSCDDMEGSQVLRPPKHDDSDEEEVVLRRNKFGQRRPRIVVGSDDETTRLIQRSSPNVQRDSVESQTEDENDKENSEKLMYDRSEDKENKAVVRHESLSAEFPSGSSRSRTLIDNEDGPRDLWLSDFDAITHSSVGNTLRFPLKDISKDEDTPSPKSKSSFTDRLLQSAAKQSPHNFAPALSSPILRSERIGQIDRLSLDLENDESGPPELKTLQLSCLERLAGQISPEPSLISLNPLSIGGLSQLFSAEEKSSSRSIGGVENDGLSLTLDVGLKPALEVSGTLRQKAGVILEKEQECVIAAAVGQNNGVKELLYVNDHGFLTQTRPEGSSPQIYRMTPSQVSKLAGTQDYSTQTQLFSTRPPLRTLSFTASQGLSPEPQPLRRLRKRSLSPLEQKVHGRNSNPVVKLDAFSILGKVPKPSPIIHDKSDFVAIEAEESDEDDTFGFGVPKKEDEEEDETEQDKIVEGLVDDTFMNVETEAADLVQEKHREHEEEEDQRLQKLHQGVIEGKLRVKRRDRGVGFEDDSEDDEDDDERRIRQRMHKKRKIEGDSLEALGQSEETRAFYNTYHQDLVDEDDEFGYLRGDNVVPPGNAVATEKQEEQETVSRDEIRERVREMAQNKHTVEALDPEDTSWIDQSMIAEGENTVRVKVVVSPRSKPMNRRPGDGQIGFDGEGPTRHEENEQERKLMMSWAKDQNHLFQGTGRSSNMTAVTGHALKAKSRGGSLRLTQPTTVNATRKAKTSSLLSTVSNRSSKFT